MEQIRIVLEKYYDKLGEWGPAVIAGGSVRDTLLSRKPSDIDIFVLTSGHEYPCEDSISDVLGVWVHETQIYADFTTFSATTEDGAIQFIFVPQSSVDELLATFDWNICQYAINLDGDLISPHDVGPEALDLKFVATKAPFIALKRGFQFEERFSKHMTDQDLRTLARMTVEDRYKIIEDVTEQGNVL